MPEVVIPYAPRPQQREVHALMRKARFGVLVCHRRFGKTVLAVNELIRGALECKKSRPRFGYIAPTYAQGKAIAWDYFKHYAAAVPGVAVNQSELRVDFPNGGQVRIFGADSPDSLRGLYFDGIVCDEFGLMQANVYSEVLAPTLVDRAGWALFIGTPNGKNQFWEMSQTAQQREPTDRDWFFRSYPVSKTELIPADELARARSTMTGDEYAQEFECSFEAAVKGAIYARELEMARADGRITRVPYEPTLPVDTDWDLGILDPTAIWFSQSTRAGEIRLIDYAEGSGEALPFWVSLLNSKPYHYGKHYVPHDAGIRTLGTGRSPLETAASLGLRLEVGPRVRGIHVGDEVEEGIHAARMLFPRCWFDSEKCKHGIEALMGYRRDFNTRLGEFKATPVHDKHSHGSDAFRYLAVRHRAPVQFAKPGVEVPQVYAWT